MRYADNVFDHNIFEKDTFNLFPYPVMLYLTLPMVAKIWDLHGLSAAEMPSQSVPL